MSEKATRQTLLAACPALDGWAIESPRTGPGIPDVWFGTCCVETKCLKQWPARPDSPVVLKHQLTIPQYLRLNKRWRSGYPAFVLLQVRRLEWLLFTAPASECLKNKHEVPKAVLIMRALRYWKDGLPKDEVTHILGLRMHQLKEEEGLD